MLVTPTYSHVHLSRRYRIHGFGGSWSLGFRGFGGRGFRALGVCGVSGYRGLGFGALCGFRNSGISFNTFGFAFMLLKV